MSDDTSPFLKVFPKSLEIEFPTSMEICREVCPALYQQFHIMEACRSAGSELPPLVLIAYKVFPFVGMCGLPAFFEVVT